MKDTLTAILIYLFLIASVVTSPTAQGGGRFSRASTYDQPSNVTGRAFNRFVQIWLENASFQNASQNSDMQWLASQGIILTNSYAISHPSQPNYIASVSGETFGLQNDNDNDIPSFIATVVDLLDTRNISWAEYLEDYPGDPTTSTQGLYARKHNPLASYQSVSGNSTRAANFKSFVDFDSDLSARRLPQWMVVVPNTRNDGHDTGLAFGAQWLRGWLEPLLKDEYFFNETLIVVTFDEAEPENVVNHIDTVILGGAVPPSARGTTTTMYFNHYSALSTVSVNWDLPSLGRWDCAANVFPPVAEKANYTNTDIVYGSMKWDVSYPGPLNRDAETLPGFWPYPETVAHCAADKGVLPAVIDHWGRSTGTYNYTSVYPYNNGFSQSMGSVPAIGVNDVGDSPTDETPANDSSGPLRVMSVFDVSLMLFCVALMHVLFG